MSWLESALTAVGELLRAENHHVGIVVVGGATLNLTRMVIRTTSDVDVIARAERGASGEVQLVRARPFPAFLVDAVRTAARDLSLAENWLNADVGAQWDQGIPPWVTEDITWRNYGGGLEVGLVGRRTLIALKLHAAADSGPKSVHAGSASPRALCRGAGRSGLVGCWAGSIGKLA